MFFQIYHFVNNRTADLTGTREVERYYMKT